MSCFSCLGTDMVVPGTARRNKRWCAFFSSWLNCLLGCKIHGMAPANRNCELQLITPHPTCHVVVVVVSVWNAGVPQGSSHDRDSPFNLTRTQLPVACRWWWQGEPGMNCQYECPVPGTRISPCRRMQLYFWGGGLCHSVRDAVTSLPSSSDLHCGSGCRRPMRVHANARQHGTCKHASRHEARAHTVLGAVTLNVPRSRAALHRSGFWNEIVVTSVATWQVFWSSDMSRADHRIWNRLLLNHLLLYVFSSVWPSTACIIAFCRRPEATSKFVSSAAHSVSHTAGPAGRGSCNCRPRSLDQLNLPCPQLQSALPTTSEEKRRHWSRILFTTGGADGAQTPKGSIVRHGVTTEIDLGTISHIRQIDQRRRRPVAAASTLHACPQHPHGLWPPTACWEREIQTRKKQAVRGRATDSAMPCCFYPLIPD